MILKYKGIRIEISRSDYEAWLDQWNLDKASVVGEGHHLLLPSCPWCDVFRMDRRGREDTCSECPLTAFEYRDGSEKVDGCQYLLEDILDKPITGIPVADWGLYFTREFIWLIGDKGRENVKKIRKAIEASVADGSDRNGLKPFLEGKEKKETGKKEKSKYGETEVPEGKEQRENNTAKESGCEDG